MNDIMKNKMYLKVSYSILEWGWIHDPKTFVVFMHLMLLANRKPHEYMGDVIKRGEVLASYEFLAEHTGLSIQNVRTAIKHLKASNTIKHRKVGKTNVFFIPSFSQQQSLGIDGNTMNNTEESSNIAVSEDMLTKETTINQPIDNQSLTSC